MVISLPINAQRRFRVIEGSYTGREL